jgi:hypothetical protein
MRNWNMPGWMFGSVALIDYYHSRPAVVPYFEMMLNGLLV